MNSISESLCNLSQKIKDRETRSPFSFLEFLEMTRVNPNIVFRNILQSFYDMIYNSIDIINDEYVDDIEAVNYVSYDCNKLFIERTEQPFFSDRLFSNRFVNHINAFRRGSRQNRIYIFEGPHGSGKSTLINNLLSKFEQHTKTDVGAIYEIMQKLDKKELNYISNCNCSKVFDLSTAIEDHSQLANDDYIEIPCPSHDHPILLIPKEYRKEFLDSIIDDQEFKTLLFNEKQFEWVFKDNPCTICYSLYMNLLDIMKCPSYVFNTMLVRRYNFDRRLGQGISVFNPGDELLKQRILTNEQIQQKLDRLFKDSNKIKYLYSRYANTNNGIYALMDIKGFNKDRLSNLHGLISESVHKVEDIEETVNSLFFATINPEDRESKKESDSFDDRISYIKVSYILDYRTEVLVYKNILGDIDKYFLPRVLDNFAKIIISTRMNQSSEAIESWVGQRDSSQYSIYCDSDYKILKMDIYTGIIPTQLKEDDRKTFTAQKRRKIINESEFEGLKGFSGRDSIKMLGDFLTLCQKNEQLITMGMVCNFFKKNHLSTNVEISHEFLDSLLNSYNYVVLQEVKESLYSYNEDHISKEILNYLFSINFDIGQTEKSPFTGEDVEISEEFLNSFESKVLGGSSTYSERKSFRYDIQKQYTTVALTQEIAIEGKDIRNTKVYDSLKQRYMYTLKENVLTPLLKNENFRNAIKDHNTSRFLSYDKKLQADVEFLIINLTKKYSYTVEGAKAVCIYIIDNKIAETFSP